MNALIPELGEGFRATFGRAPEWSARAPGRVNLIGEHTDYSEGLALPCAIERELCMVAAARDDGRIRAWSRDRGESAEFSSSALRRCGAWIDYLQGVVHAAHERGLPVSGMDVAIASELPSESGLSSSAALSVAFSRILAATQGLEWSPVLHAELAHRGENHFVGSGCGILDPFAVALGRRDHAIRIDCRTREVCAVALPSDRVRILIAHSGVRRRLAPKQSVDASPDFGGGYLDRVSECSEAVAAARQAGIVGAGARALRDLAPGDLPGLERSLEPRLFRRARHVILENRRVELFCEALRRSDFEAAGELLREGQRSLRDDYEVSTPELDHLCRVADRLPGVYGSRLTGAGFGGCSLHLISPDAGGEVSEALAHAFEQRFGARPAIIETGAAEGASAEAL